MKRVIETLWATRKSVDGGYHPPELLVAWDEFSVDANQEGWFEACTAALASLGGDLDQHRYVTLSLGDDVLEDTFFATVTADVQVVEKPS